MGVGANFNSPETKAALAAQGGQPNPGETKPPIVDPGTTEPKKEPVVEPTNQEPVNLDMSKVKPKDPPGEKLELSGNEVDKKLTDAGFDLKDLAKVLVDNAGKFPAELVSKFKETFDPALVDERVARAEAEYKLTAKEASEAAKKRNDFVFTELGGGDATKGTENFEVLKKWCNANMSKDDIAAVNTMINSDNQIIIKQGLTMAVGQWKGAQQKMMTGDSTQTTTVQKVEPLTKAEFQTIMRSEKYRTDPDYAKQIDERRRKTQETEQWSPPGFHVKPEGWS